MLMNWMMLQKNLEGDRQIAAYGTCCYLTHGYLLGETSYQSSIKSMGITHGDLT